ncbi:hypothetical protein [Breznakia pachnodae]|uniref:DUF805 domain-containing protein n=1 Tax=Breznakia pachnodae TaxID=265178 RepID=A0ABU0E6K0_9FIRM|nr:hypothetical protein [Breznakia pachnodae]MDQ0362533.1 hypothetical protein [Breznakia pachnodae]
MKIKEIIAYSKEVLYYGKSKYYTVYMIIDIISLILKMYLGFVMAKIMIKGLIYLPMIEEDYNAFLNVFQTLLPLVFLLALVHMAYVKFIERKQIFMNFYLSIIASSPITIFMVILIINGLSVPRISNQYLNELMIVGTPWMVCLVIQTIMRITVRKKNLAFSSEGSRYDKMQEASEEKSKVEQDVSD